MPTKAVREWRREHGKCEQCGRPGDEEHYRCSVCRGKRRSEYKDKVAAGICVAPSCKNPATHDKMCESCRLNMRERDNRKHKKIRDDAFKQYGGYKCSCPGCHHTTPQFMQLDHINNDGGAHRREIGGKQDIGGCRMYYWLKRHNWPKIVQPMCANCNFAKGHYGACPHAGAAH